MEEQGGAGGSPHRGKNDDGKERHVPQPEQRPKPGPKTGPKPGPGPVRAADIDEASRLDRPGQGHGYRGRRKGPE